MLPTSIELKFGEDGSLSKSRNGPGLELQSRSLLFPHACEHFPRLYVLMMGVVRPFNVKGIPIHNPEFF